MGSEERREVDEGARKSEGGIIEKHSSTAALKNGKHLKPYHISEAQQKPLERRFKLSFSYYYP